MARTKKPATKKADTKAAELEKAPEMTPPTAPLEDSPSRASKKQPEKKGTRIKQVARERAFGIAHLRSKDVSSKVPDPIPTISKKAKVTAAVKGKGKENVSVPVKKASSKSKKIPKPKPAKVSKGSDKEGEKLDKIIEEIAQSVEEGANKDFSDVEISDDEGSVYSAHEEEEVVAEDTEEADVSESDNEKDVSPEDEEKDTTPPESEDINSEKESEGVEEEQSMPTEAVEPVEKPKRTKASVTERKSKRLRKPVCVEEEAMKEDDLESNPKGKKPREDRDEEFIAGSVWIDEFWFKSVEFSRVLLVYGRKIVECRIGRST